MAEFLLEVGCEELPATFVEKAYTDLASKLEVSLGAAFGAAFEAQKWGTPRRLIVAINGIPERQADREEDVRGPGIKAAYTADGTPSPALQGFCRGQGVDPSTAREQDGYIWITKKIAGRSAAEILSEEAPKAIRSLSFEKSMRWGTSRMRFARPIRWLLAVLDGAIVPFEIEGVQSSNMSRGHRFYQPEPFMVGGLEGFLEGLRSRFVEPDKELRREKIVTEAVAVAKSVGGVARMNFDLVDENVFLTEWPTAIIGQFREQHLDLPPAVLTTAMAKHEKMFPVEDAEGKLTNHFIFIRNSGEDDSVRRGNEWVLNARLDDAQFFFKEDQKHSMDDFLERTNSIVFQEKLGTVRERADRLSKLAGSLAGDAAWRSHAEKAALYAKADLATGLVSELASLQGIIGGEYAKREGFAPEVCYAIANQYKFDFTQPIEGASQEVAACLALADALDKLAGYLGIGLAPTGSSDPFGLRRAATTVIEACIHWPNAFRYAIDTLLDGATLLYRVDPTHILNSVNEDRARTLMRELLVSRYTALFSDVDHRELVAALEDPAYPRGVVFRLQCVKGLTGESPFVQTALRPLNILAAADKKGISYPKLHVVASLNSPNLDSETGDALLKACEDILPDVLQANKSENPARLMLLLTSLEDPINAFFDSTMIMADDENVRSARLALLYRVSQLLNLAGDFTKL